MATSVNELNRLYAVLPVELAAHRAGVAWPPVLGKTNCPYCGTAGTLFASQDPNYSTAWWFLCEYCDFHGDQFELLAGAYEDATGEPVAQPKGKKKLSAAQSVKRYVALRRAMYEFAIGKGVVTENVTRLTCAYELEVYPQVAGLWRIAAPIEACNAIRVNPTTMVAGKTPALIVPLYGAPGLVNNLLTVDTARKESYIAALTLRTCYGLAFGPLIWKYRLAGNPAPWGRRVLVAPSLRVALHLHSTHQTLFRGRYPGIVSFTGVNPGNAVIAANVLPKDTVFWFLPNDFTYLRCVIACGGKIAFGTPALTTYHEYPAWITEKILDAAKPWQEALLAHVQSAGSHAVRQGLNAAGYSLEFHQQMPEALKEVLAPYVLRDPAYGGQTSVGPYHIKETNSGWVNLKNGRLLTDTVLVIEEIAIRNNAVWYNGTITQNAQVASFELSSREFRRDPHGCIERLCVENNLELPQIEPRFAPYYVQTAIRLRKPATSTPADETSIT